MVSGYPKTTNIPRVDRLSTDPRDLGRQTHQGIIGGGTRQIMFFLVQDISEGMRRTTKCS